jgi:hypothetical protein
MLDQLRKREDRPVHSAILPSPVLSETVAVERAVIGLFFTGVKLTAGPGIAPGITVAGTAGVSPALEASSGRKR